MKSFNNKRNLSELCEMLFDANFNIYELENKKWWGRKNKTASSIEIDKWDYISRAWNEKRSICKKEIDITLQKIFHKETKNVKNKELLFSVFPISMMIDMMTIERIKIYDLTNKNDISGVKNARIKLRALKQLIDTSMIKIASEKRYFVTQEARTF